MPKGFQNGAEIDAKTHQKSMPELVSEKIKKIMKIHVFLKAQNTLKYRKGHHKQGFRTMSARTGEVPKNIKVVKTQKF